MPWFFSLIFLIIYLIHVCLMFYEHILFVLHGPHVKYTLSQMIFVKWTFTKYTVFAPFFRCSLVECHKLWHYTGTRIMFPLNFSLLCATVDGVIIRHDKKNFVISMQLAFLKSDIP